MKQTHTKPTDFKIIEVMLNSQQHKWVICIAQYSPAPRNVNRYLTFELKESQLIFHRADWISNQDWETLKAQIENSHHIIGDCDAMYHGGASLIWFEEDDHFYLYDDNKRLLGCTTQQIDFKEMEITNSDISHWHAALSADWTLRSLKIQLQNNQSHTVVEIVENMAIADPCYDAIDLLCDASWLGELGKALSRFTGIPLQMDDGL